MTTLKPIDAETLAYNLKRVLANDDLKMPQNYLVLDLETTTLDPISGAIWQYGILPVAGGQVLGSKTGTSVNLLLPAPELEKAAFEIERRRDTVVARDPQIPKELALKQASADFVSEVSLTGVAPRLALEILLDLIKCYEKPSHFLVGQNFAKYDLPFIEYYAKRWGLKFERNTDRVIDTGMLIKAGVLRRHILERETVMQFYARVAYERASGVYYALEKFCVPYWHLDTKYGIDVTKAHDAGYDCHITDIVLRELVAEAKNGGPL